MPKKYWIIDAGHGGMVDGKYTTAPDKMHTFEDGYTIYEGVTNRAIARELVALFRFNGCIDFALVYDEKHDTPLSTRAKLVNKLYEKYPNAVSLSIHSNAGGGSGNEIFTSAGETEADGLAELLYETIKEQLPEFRFRPDLSDGDHDKEARFYMVGYESNGVRVGPKCPAILAEFLFFDNRKEAEFLNSFAGQQRIARCLFDWILRVEAL